MRRILLCVVAVLGVSVWLETALACDYGIASLTVSSGTEETATTTERGLKETIVIPAPSGVAADGKFPNAVDVKGVATPNNAGFKTGPKGDVMWTLRKGSGTISQAGGGSTQTFSIDRLGRYVFEAFSQRHLKIAVVVGPKIICDAGDKGRLGDEVPSIKNGDQEEGERHFVTPKKSDALNDDYVTFSVLGMAHQQFEQLCEWRCEPATSGTKHPTDVKKYMVKRNDAGHVKLSVRLLSDNSELDKISVWVVWCSESSSPSVLAPYVDIDSAGTTIGGYLEVVHNIAPAGIVDETEDIPDLRGDSTKPQSVPSVPSDEEGVYQAGLDLSNGAKKKWDSTRQLKTKIINPNSVPFPNVVPEKFKTAFPNYPIDSLAGNDDFDDYSEENDAYSAPYKGGLWGYDDPSMALVPTVGNVGDTVEFRWHFREFARLQIAGKWYPISDPYPWKLHMKFKKVAELDPDGNPATDDAVDLNHDKVIGSGPVNGEVWINDTSEFKRDNSDF